MIRAQRNTLRPLEVSIHQKNDLGRKDHSKAAIRHLSNVLLLAGKSFVYFMVMYTNM